MNQADLIEATVEELDRRGWCQGAVENLRGEVCLGGAYSYASSRYQNEFYIETLQLLGKKAMELGFICVVDYNDYPGRTYDEVRDFLLGVAKDLRNTSIPEEQDLRNAGEN